MRLLIDTHVLIWMRREPKRLSGRAVSLLQDITSNVHVSAVSAWEIANKVRIGKLTFDADFLDDFDSHIRALAFEPLAITAKHAVAGASLPGKHKDPFDRMLAGQASVEGLKLVSADPAFALLGIETLWDA